MMLIETGTMVYIYKSNTWFSRFHIYKYKIMCDDYKKFIYIKDNTVLNREMKRWDRMDFDFFQTPRPTLHYFEIRSRYFSKAISENFVNVTSHKMQRNDLK